MFRCTECKTEYEIKPDYCDCGNDTFEEILPQKEIKPEPKPIIKEEVKQVKQEIPKVETQVKKQKKKKNFFDPFSTIFFSICVVLSFIIIFFVGNPKENDIDVASKKEQTTQNMANIPNLNSLWNNALPKVEQPQQAENNIPKTVEIVVDETEPQTYIPPVQIPQPKVQNKPTVKPQNQIKPQQPIKTQNTQTKIVVQPQTQTVQNVSQPQTQTAKQPQQQTKPTQVQTTVAKPKTVQSQANKQELANYKLSLRNKIANRINFANVIGDGTCVVSFNIASNGALQNRKFQQQSDNFTLNDVVYNAVMQTPSYNPPPTGYKYETMRLTVKMLNGNFEVSLK